MRKIKYFVRFIIDRGRLIIDRILKSPLVNFFLKLLLNFIKPIKNITVLFINTILQYLVNFGWFIYHLIRVIFFVIFLIIENLILLLKWAYQFKNFFLFGIFWFLILKPLLALFSLPTPEPFLVGIGTYFYLLYAFLLQILWVLKESKVLFYIFLEQFFNNNPDDYYYPLLILLKTWVLLPFDSFFFILINGITLLYHLLDSMYWYFLSDINIIYQHPWVVIIFYLLIKYYSEVSLILFDLIKLEYKYTILPKINKVKNLLLLKLKFFDMFIERLDADICNICNLMISKYKDNYPLFMKQYPKLFSDY